MEGMMDNTGTMNQTNTNDFATIEAALAAWVHTEDRRPYLALDLARRFAAGEAIADELDLARRLAYRALERSASLADYAQYTIARQLAPSAADLAALYRWLAAAAAAAAVDFACRGMWQEALAAARRAISESEIEVRS